eukprot:GFYU01004011.1.p1 GENE.GFYU01004011.1~~GFYU01004011.1.p1  ORF type:complete len:665 (+),score=159.46 GFYU01004011.1:232-2226(+)
MDGFPAPSAQFNTTSNDQQNANQPQNPFMTDGLNPGGLAQAPVPSFNSAPVVASQTPAMGSFNTSVQPAVADPSQNPFSTATPETSAATTAAAGFGGPAPDPFTSQQVPTSPQVSNQWVAETDVKVSIVESAQPSAEETPIEAFDTAGDGAGGSTHDPYAQQGGNEFTGAQGSTNDGYDSNSAPVPVVQMEEIEQTQDREDHRPGNQMIDIKALRIDNIASKTYNGALLTFFITFFICFLISVTGPQDAWDSHETEYLAFGYTGDKTYYGYVTDVTPYNQMLLLYMAPNNRLYRETGLEKTIHYDISIHGTNQDDGNPKDWDLIAEYKNLSKKFVCEDTRPSCEPMLIMEQSVSSGHKVFEAKVTILHTTEELFWVGDIQFTFFYVDDTFTDYELSFVYCFLMPNLFFAVWYMTACKRHQHWTGEPKWIAILLCAMFGLNNPFYAVVPFVGGKDAEFFYAFFLFLFFAVLLTFWLMMVDSYGKPEEKQKSYRFYLPKVLITFLYYLLTLIGFGMLLNDQGNTVPYGELMGFFYFIGILWFFAFIYYIARTMGVLPIMPQYRSQRFRVFCSFTFFIAVALCMGLLYGVLSTGTHSYQVFVYYALINLYIYTVAFLYMPIGNLSVAAPRDPNAPIPMRGLRPPSSSSSSDDDNGRVGGQRRPQQMS